MNVYAIKFNLFRSGRRWKKHKNKQRVLKQLTAFSFGTCISTSMSNVVYNFSIYDNIFYLLIWLLFFCCCCWEYTCVKVNITEHSKPKYPNLRFEIGFEEIVCKIQRNTFLYPQWPQVTNELYLYTNLRYIIVCECSKFVLYWKKKNLFTLGTTTLVLYFLIAIDIQMNKKTLSGF